MIHRQAFKIYTISFIIFLCFFFSFYQFLLCDVDVLITIAIYTLYRLVTKFYVIQIAYSKIMSFM